MKKSILFSLLMLLCALHSTAQMPQLTQSERVRYRAYNTDMMFDIAMQHQGSDRLLAYVDTLKYIAAAKDSTLIMAGTYGLLLSHYRMVDNPRKMREVLDSLQQYPFTSEWDEYVYSCWLHYPNYLSDKRHYSEALKALEELQEYTAKHSSKHGRIFFHYSSGYLFLAMFQSEQAETHIKQALELTQTMIDSDFRRSMTVACNALLLRTYDAGDKHKEAKELALQILKPESQTNDFGRLCAFVALLCNDTNVHNPELRHLYADSIEALIYVTPPSAGVQRTYNKYKSVYAMHEGQMDSAIYYANQAVDTLNVLVRTAMIYDHFGYYKEAYDYECRAYRELNLRSRADLTASLSQHVDRIEKERLKHELLISQTETRQKILIYSIIFMAVIILVVVFEIVNTMHHNRELEREKLATQEALKEAEQASRMKTVFLQNISHEVRTPLNAISGFSDILMCGISLTPEQQSEYAELVRHNVDLLTTLMSDTITLSDLDSQTVVPEMSDINLTSLCGTIIDETPVHKYMQPGVTFHYDNPDHNIVRHTDPQLLLSILTHLLSNAFKYTSEGSVTMSLRDTADGRAQIAITDTGCGIAPENAERVFERFEKLGSFIQGNGLGLSIARKQAQLIGATVTLDTTHQGKGARFVVEV